MIFLCPNNHKKKSSIFCERDIWLSSFGRFRLASRGAMKDFENFVGGRKPDNSAIESSMKLFDTVLESLSHALSL